MTKIRKQDLLARVEKLEARVRYLEARGIVAPPDGTRTAPLRQCVRCSRLAVTTTLDGICPTCALQMLCPGQLTPEPTADEEVKITEPIGRAQDLCNAQSHPLGPGSYRGGED